ncbi:MAG TPA: M4 family metallopeptidase, partial [Micromonosporaceae bacterium]
MRTRRGLVSGAILVAVCALTLTAAAPPGVVALSPGGGALVRSGAGAGSVTGVSGRPVARPPVEPPVGALAVPAAVAELRRATEASLVETDRLGRVVSLAARPGASIANPAGNGVDGFVRRYAAAFGLSRGYEAVRARTTRLPGGDRVVRYQQVAGGLPVIGGEIVVTTDGQGRVLGVASEASPAAPTATTAVVAAAGAGRAAVAAAVRRFGLDPTGLRAGSATLWLYDPGLIGAPGRAGSRPTWWVEVTGPGGEQVATVLVDGADSVPVLVLKAKQEVGRDRIVCDLNGVEDVREVDLNNPAAYNCGPGSVLGVQPSTRTETGSASSVAEVNRAFDHLGVTYDFYRSNFSIDSFDGLGARVRATVRACQKDIVYGGQTYDFPCPYHNAFWDGAQLVFGQGYAVDDVVGHEYTHAVIDHSSQLFYAYESGAINESLADIFGEFIDQSYAGPGEDTSKLWLIGEDLPLEVGSVDPEIRDMANPNRFADPAAYKGQYYYLGDADNGGVHWNSGVGNKLAHLIAGGLGLAKSKLIWYRVMVMLPSASTYPMLGQAVTRACVELIGTAGITRDDCWVTIANARMSTSLGHWEPELACPDTVTGVKLIFKEDFETPGGWTLDPQWQFTPSPAYPESRATSGKGALHGYAPGGPTSKYRYATISDPITIPTQEQAGGSHIYLSYQALAPLWGPIMSTPEVTWWWDDLNDNPGDGTDWKTFSFIDNIGSSIYFRLSH